MEEKLKLFFETDALNELQIRKMCHICIEAGADFVKRVLDF